MQPNIKIFQQTSQISQHIIIRVPDYPITQRFDFPLTKLILFLLLGQGMNISVDLYDEPFPWSAKVGNVRSDSVLSSKFEPRESFGTQFLPEDPFRPCCLSPEIPPSWNQGWQSESRVFH